MCVCVCVCVCVCMCVYVCVCVSFGLYHSVTSNEMNGWHSSVSLCTYVVFVYMYIHAHVSVWGCMYTFAMI